MASKTKTVAPGDTVSYRAGRGYGKAVVLEIEGDKAKIRNEKGTELIRKVDALNKE